jgi:hypothetical protein
MEKHKMSKSKFKKAVELFKNPLKDFSPIDYFVCGYLAEKENKPLPKILETV